VQTQTEPAAAAAAEAKEEEEEEVTAPVQRLEYIRPRESYADLESAGDFDPAYLYQQSLEILSVFDSFEGETLTVEALTTLSQVEHVFNITRWVPVEQVVQKKDADGNFVPVTVQRNQPMPVETVVAKTTTALVTVRATTVVTDATDDAEVQEITLDAGDKALLKDESSSASADVQYRDVQVELTLCEDYAKRVAISGYRTLHFEDVPLVEVATTATATSTEQEGLLFLDVMSMNIWNFNYWGKRIQMLSAIVTEQEPAIIGFQEVRMRQTQRGMHNQAQDLAVLLGGQYQYVSQPAMGFHEAEGTEYHLEGLAIFSKYPILSSKTLYLSRDPDDEEDFHQRLCLSVIVQTPLGKINFLNTHQTLSDKARERTLREIGTYIQEQALPCVIVGDFNAVFTPETDVLGNEFGLEDAWLATHPDATEEEGWTFQSWDPRSRIDYIYYSQDTLEAETMEILGKDSEPAPDARPLAGVEDMRDLMYASDHWFLKARLKLKR
jgi:endonuclease/exonuclease/phosphatase family metal-dependent hydrolase